MKSRILQPITALRADEVRLSLAPYLLIIALALESCSPASVAPLYATTSPAATSTTISTSTPVPTETPTPTATKVMLNVSPDVQKALEDQKALNADGSIIDKLAHSEAATKVAIIPESITVLPANNIAVGEIIVGLAGDNRRYIWNFEIGSWVPEWQFSQTYVSAQIIELSAVYDGSLRLSALSYFAEHPNLIPPGAITPHYKINVQRNSVSINLFRFNQHLWPDANDPEKETIIDETKINEQRSWGWLGIIRLLDGQDNEIVLLSDIRKNPTPQSPDNVLPAFNGFDRRFFLEQANLIGSDGLNLWERLMQTNDLQLIIAFPYPAEFVETMHPDEWGYSPNLKLPHVAQLLKGQNIYQMFPPEIREQMWTMFVSIRDADNRFSTPEKPFSFPLDVLPDELSTIVIFPGFEGFKH